MSLAFTMEVQSKNFTFLLQIKVNIKRLKYLTLHDRSKNLNLVSSKNW